MSLSCYSSPKTRIQLVKSYHGGPTSSSLDSDSVPNTLMSSSLPSHESPWNPSVGDEVFSLESMTLIFMPVMKLMIPALRHKGDPYHVVPTIHCLPYCHISIYENIVFLIWMLCYPTLAGFPKSASVTLWRRPPTLPSGQADPYVEAFSHLLSHCQHLLHT